MQGVYKKVIKKNSRESIVISKNVFNNVPLVDIRIHYKDENGDLKPTRKGISIREDNLDDFVSTLSTFAGNIKLEKETETAA
jgi:single-stranded DNA-specific DHH superfamily exonuclease